MSKRRRGAVFAIALMTSLATVSVANVAQAAPPTRTTEPPLDFASNALFCGFPLRAETLKNNVKITTFSDGHQTRHRQPHRPSNESSPLVNR